MNESNPIPAPEVGETQSGHLREIFTDAIRYWERRRIIYNSLLTAVVLIWIVGTWPHFRPAFTWPSLGASGSRHARESLLLHRLRRRSSRAIFILS